MAKMPDKGRMSSDRAFAAVTSEMGFSDTASVVAKLAAGIRRMTTMIAPRHHLW
jgi:hypothetical protein